jgi:hypothetical protein
LVDSPEQPAVLLVALRGTQLEQVVPEPAGRVELAKLDLVLPDGVVQLARTPG